MIPSIYLIGTLKSEDTEHKKIFLWFVRPVKGKLDSTYFLLIVLNHLDKGEKKVDENVKFMSIGELIEAWRRIARRDAEVFCYQEFSVEIADNYDLIIGLHPDEATRAVAEGACVRPAILIPCCNFWDQTKKLGREAMLAEISNFYDERNVEYQRVAFDFDSSKNVGLVSKPKHYNFR